MGFILSAQVAFAHCLETLPLQSKLVFCWWVSSHVKGKGVCIGRAFWYPRCLGIHLDVGGLAQGLHVTLGCKGHCVVSLHSKGK